VTTSPTEIRAPQGPRVSAGTPLEIWVPLVVLWLVWGSTYLAIAVTTQTMPPLLSAALRFLAAALILGVGLTMFKGIGVLRVSIKEVAFAGLMGVMLLGVGLGTVSLAEQHIPSGIAALLVSVNALWVVLLRMRAGQRPSRLTLAGVAVGIVGLAFMLLPGGTAVVSGTDGDVVLWSAAVLVSAFSWAFFSFKSTGYPLPRNVLVMTFYELAIAALALFGVGAVAGERLDFTVVTHSSWFALGWLVLASIIGFSAYGWLLNKAPLSLTSTYAYVNPVVAVLLGSLILSEPLTRDVIVGLTVVLGGVILVINGERRTR
jgi:drug/metabolite transporter (DMT)-like permease